MGRWRRTDLAAMSQMRSERKNGVDSPHRPPKLECPSNKAAERQAELLGVERKNVNEFDELNAAADNLHAATNRLNAKMDEMRDCLCLPRDSQTCGRKPSQFQRVVRWIRQHFCRHTFRLADLQLTGIKEAEKPASSAPYKEQEAWFINRYTEDAFTKRVSWRCSKCGRIFYAHCGLDISPEHGPIIPPNARADLPPTAARQPRSGTEAANGG